MQAETQVKVWDPVVRIFHWLLVATFAIAFITEEDFLSLHVWAGYLLGIAIVFRIIWGFIGTRHARFSDFVTSPANALSYAKDALTLRAKRYLGHNPAGGLMIIVMIVSLVLTTFSGIVLYGVGDHAGPMAFIFAGKDQALEHLLEETHEFFANFTLLLVFIHVMGVLFESIAHRENLVSAMINGFKRANS